MLAARVTARLAREYEAAVGLPLPEARVMIVLGFFKPISSNAIVQHTTMDKATVSRAIARLLRRRLLTRQPDPRDRRLLILGFTAKGARIHEQLAKLARDWENWLVVGLSRPKLASLDAALLYLTNRLDERAGLTPRPRQ